MGNSIEKRTIAQFVHDAVEMETAIFTLEQMMDTCSEKKNSIVYDAEHQIMETEKELREAEKELDYKKSRRKKENSFLAKVGNIVGNVFESIYEVWDCYLKWALIVLLSGTLPSVAILCEVCHVPYYKFFIVYGIIVAIAILIVPITLYVIFLKETTNSEKNYLSTLDNEYYELKNRVDSVRLKLADSKKLYEQAKINSELLDRQWHEMCDKQTSIELYLEELYSYGIIPEDYQFFDCVIILDQIFRNDLADTMREAIKIYEERVFRGSVIRGMDRIVSMLGQLSSDMSAISLKLDMINNNVAHMSSDLNRFNERIASESAKNRAVAEDLIRETQLGRYTNEKLLESNKRLEYYAEEYRMGRMPIR